MLAVAGVGLIVSIGQTDPPTWHVKSLNPCVCSWTSGVNAMSAHAVLQDFTDPAATLTALNDRLTSDPGSAHATIQLEPPGRDGQETYL